MKLLLLLLPLVLRFLFSVRGGRGRTARSFGGFPVGQHERKVNPPGTIKHLIFCSVVRAHSLSPAHPFPGSASESELSEEEDEDEEEEEEEEDELELLLPLLFLFASLPFTVLSLLTVWSDGRAAAGGDSFLVGPCDGCLASDWLLAGDLLEVTSGRRGSDWEPLLPEGGAVESLEGPCEEEERLFCSPSSFASSSLPPSFSAGSFVSLLSRAGEGEEDEEEEEPEEDEEEEDLPGGGTSFGCIFSLSLSCSTSLCLIRSFSLSRSLPRSLERERLLLLRRGGEGERRDLEEKHEADDFKGIKLRDNKTKDTNI